MYNVSHNEQTLIFIASLGLGFIFGILYDAMRAIRLSITKSRGLIIAFDLLYFFIVALGSYLFIIATNKGEVRSYIIIGELLGAAFYYFSLGFALMKLTDKLVSLLNSFYSLAFKFISFPFRLIKSAFSRVFGKLKIFFEKSEKKSKKIQKKVLPKWRVYVYNLFGILCAGSQKSQKGGKAYGKGEKQEST